VILIAVMLIWRWRQPRVRILWPTKNAVVSGLVDVVVNVAGGGCVKSLTLIVDGNELGTLRHGPMVLHLPTHYFTNGVHTIAVRAFSDAQLLNEAISPSIRVGFQNDVTVEWQPAFGTRLPIRASLAYPEADWTIQIKKEDETVLRKISGISTNGKIDVVWDTKDEQGKEVPADVVYMISIEATPRGSNDVTGLANTNTVPASYLNDAKTNCWCRPFPKSK
jgi:hypothetical protein